MSDDHVGSREPVDGSEGTIELENARARLAAIVDSSEDAIISKTLTGIVTSWNAGAVRLFGWPAEEMIGQSILKLIPQHLQHEEREILAKLREGERIERYETVRLHKNGTLLDISLTVSPVRDRNGVIIGAAKIAHDITAKREVERLVQAEARTLETLNRVGNAVAAQLELDKIVQIVTDAATEISGAAFGAFFYNVTREGQGAYWLCALSGAPREAFANFPHPRAAEVFTATFSGERVVRSDDITQHPHYGKSAPYHGMPEGPLLVRSYLAVPVHSSSEEVIGGLFFGHPEVGVFSERAERDVLGLASHASIAIGNAKLFEALRERERELERLASERETFLESERAARSEAEHLSHLKDEFLATLSHELRTPLNAIQGWTAIMKSRPRPDDDTRALATIDRNVRAQAKIINDLLDMSRIISGKIHLEMQPLQLHEVIDAALQSMRQSAEAKQITLDARLDSSAGVIRGDPNRLQQILWNLLSNAIKFTPAAGRVTIALKRVNSQAEIVVEDTGVGIPADFLPYVFERFRQADASTTRQYGGLGLGLSIVRNLVELHGGSVRVKSAGENLGSTFIVALPLSQARAESAKEKALAPEPPASADLPRLDGVRVLIVDDEPDGSAMVARILEGRGAVSRCAGDGAEALRCLITESFDILLSDIGLPKMDGYELIRHIRGSSSPSSRIPAVALTAYARTEDRQRSLLAGYQMHIAKPIEAPELVAGIASLLHIRC